MSRILTFLYAVLFCLLLFQAQAQFVNPEFERYGPEQGLSQSHVFSVAQDKTGFLWFGTDDGLNRFDGHQVVVVRQQENEPLVLPSNSIRALLVSRDSSLWIGTGNGVSHYFPSLEKFVHYPIKYDDPKHLSGVEVSAIKEHPDGSIWISYVGDGLNIIYPGKEEIAKYNVNQNSAYKLRTNLVSSLLFMTDGNTLVGTLEGIQVIDPQGFVMKPDEVFSRYPWMKQIDPSIKTMLLSRDRLTMWIATENNGFYKVDLVKQIVTSFNKSNRKTRFNFITCLFEDSFGNIWIGSEELYVIDKKGNFYSHERIQIRGNKKVKTSIECIFEDKDKNIWLGSYSAGVLQYSPENRQVKHYFVTLENESFPDIQILDFAPFDKDNIWIGTDGEGLLNFNASTGIFSKSILDKKLSSRVIKTIHRDKKGIFWLGTWDGGMMRIDATTNKLEVFHPDNHNFESIHVWDIDEDQDGNLWIATLRDGLCFFSPKTRKYHHFKNNEKDSSSIANNDVMTLLFDANNTLWAGTSNGLSILYPGTTRFINIYSDSTSRSLSNNLINCLHEDRQGRIWVGTNGGGITIFNKDRKLIRIINEKDGLPNNNVSSILSDKRGDLWVSTFRGLAKISFETLNIVQIPQAGNLQEKEFTTESWFQTSSGKIFLGNTNGFDVFHPDSLAFTPRLERVVFTSLKIFNHKITSDSLYDGRQIISKAISEANEIQLSHKDYSFTIEFSPLTYNWQKNLHYAYLLQNLDKEWQYTTADRRFVHYSSLTPGEYILKVKASFDGHTWPDQMTTIRISISKPWWSTMTFKIGSVALFLMILGIIYKVRVTFLERQQSKLERLVNMRTAELTQSYRELKEKNEEIEMQKAEIQLLLQELSMQKNDIEQKNEELQAQHDTLSVKSSALEETQKNLQDVNKNLELLIERRTNKLNTAVRELETFLYRASHDLRGPISSMLGLIRVAELENGNSDHLYTNFLRKTTMRLERTLSKLVQKHTIQKSKLMKEIITADSIAVMLKEISVDIPHFRTNDFIVKIDDTINFETDKPMLAILLTNLIENAFFFSEQAKDKTVQLDITQTDETVFISVQDFGPGIQADLKDKIFTMFFRGSELSTGNGLGLYLVQNALIRINGKISLATEEGKFTRFTIALNSL
jgi:ligand-binding sensor domain-containing protein/signal transduction histidine kinase